MPFTFSHPAIILPLNYLPKKWISLTGLVIGSLTPDFEYFIRMKIESNYSHTFWGIFWFDLPLGILLTFIFHNIVKTELFKNLPKELNQRFVTEEELNWSNYFAEKWKMSRPCPAVGGRNWCDPAENHGRFCRSSIARKPIHNLA